jgi:hypothetical protein
MPIQESRAGQLNAVIDAKLLFHAKIAARYKGETLVEFIEGALRLALTREVMMGNQPNSGHAAPTGPKPVSVLWLESLWDEDEVVRLFKVGMHDRTFLAPKQRAIYDHVLQSLIKQGKKITLKNCVESIDASERE